ncbi:hypothetical protein [Aestuariivirga sp.]|uniref:hypothetical protein n=1 Tax=Aestuariivirga sp. TaxID=2650926 RepID=UPI0035ADA639
MSDPQNRNPKVRHGMMRNPPIRSSRRQPAAYDEFLVACQEGAERLSERRVAQLLGRPLPRVQTHEDLRRLARQVEMLAPCHRDPERFHERKSDIAAELRRLASWVHHG